MVDGQSGWLTDVLFSRLDGFLAGWLVVWLVGWLVGWWIGGLVDWLVGRSVGRSHACFLVWLTSFHSRLKFSK